MDENLSITTGADLLAVMCHTLGYQPSDSLVLVTLQDKRVGVTLRVDLPSVGMDVDSRAAESFAFTMTNHLIADELATGTLLAVFTDQDTHPGFVEALMRELDRAGMPIRDGWLVTGQGWKEYFALDAEFQPLEMITESLANLELTFRGSSYTDHRTAVSIPEFTGAPETVETIKAAAALLEAQMHPDADPEDGEAEQVATARALWGQALDTGTVEGNALELVTYFQNVVIRDRLMADLIDPSTDQVTYGRTLLGEVTERPDWARVGVGETLLMDLLAAAPGECRAPLLTALCWVSWLKGFGSVAAEYCALALEAGPGYRLAYLMDQLLGAGLIAAVAKNPATAYRKH